VSGRGGMRFRGQRQTVSYDALVQCRQETIGRSHRQRGGHCVLGQWSSNSVS
jgi:hypothetical protein